MFAPFHSDSFPVPAICYYERTGSSVDSYEWSTSQAWNARMAEIRDINPNIFFIVNILSNQFHFNAALGRSAGKPFDDDIGPERSCSGRKSRPVNPDDNVASPGRPDDRWLCPE